jgi:hypothetical protein
MSPVAIIERVGEISATVALSVSSVFVGTL